MKSIKLLRGFYFYGVFVGVVCTIFSVLFTIAAVAIVIWGASHRSAGTSLVSVIAFLFVFLLVGLGLTGFCIAMTVNCFKKATGSDHQILHEFLPWYRVIRMFKNASQPDHDVDSFD